MTNQENTARLLPDVAVHAQPHLAGALDWVGMAEIQVPVRFDAGDGDVQRASARVPISWTRCWIDRLTNWWKTAPARSRTCSEATYWSATGSIGMSESA